MNLRELLRALFAPGQPPHIPEGRSRRDFLRAVLTTGAAAALAPALDIDKLLWVPGERTILLPDPDLDEFYGSAVFASKFKTSSNFYTKEILDMLAKQLKMANLFNREYDDTFSIQGARVGQIINIKIPERY